MGIAGRFAMVAGTNSETAGIIWNRSMKSELSRKICDRSFDGRSRSGFPIRVLASEIISERIVYLLQIAKERLVLREFLQTCLPRKLEHPHGIVVRPVPQIRIEMSEQPARQRLPRPPDVEAHFPQRLERRGESGNHVISMERRHERQRMKLSKNSWAASLSIRQMHNAANSRAD